MKQIGLGRTLKHLPPDERARWGLQNQSRGMARWGRGGLVDSKVHDHALLKEGAFGAKAENGPRFSPPKPPIFSGADFVTFLRPPNHKKRIFAGPKKWHKKTKLQ